MNRNLTRLLFAAGSLVIAQAVHAQSLFDPRPADPHVRTAPQKPFVPKTSPKPEAAEPALADPPYQSRLDRLSEILGALHYLRPLCQPAEKGIWRTHMLELLDAENPTEQRRERMIGAFNRTYSGFRENYRKCNASAKLAGERYREEGIRLSRDLTSRFTD